MLYNGYRKEVKTTMEQMIKDIFVYSKKKVNYRL